MILIVAEKATAAQTLAKELGDDQKIFQEGNIKYWKIQYQGKEAIVFPLKGHILDVDFEKGFEKWDMETINKLHAAPIIYKEKEKEIIKKLKELGEQAEELIIATDYDSEGEAIGLEAVEIVKQVNPNIKVKRALFSTLSKKELEKSFSELKDVNINLAQSANARREIDLLIGASLTRLLSVSANRLGYSFLSVGRVQTPTLAIIAKKEEEIENFKPEKYYVLKFEGEGMQLMFKKPFKTKEDIPIKEGKAKLKIEKIVKKESEVPPPVPFNTTEFLRAAASIGINVPTAMKAAEDLYMRGFISYPRTDNQVYPPTLDFEEILGELRKNKVYEEYIDKNLTNGIKPTKGKEALDHPPIYPIKLPEGVNELEMKVFDLIARRFLATLSNSEKVLLTKVIGSVEGLEFETTGKVVIERGWKEIYPVKEKEVILPKVEEGGVIEGIIKAEEKETLPPNRYSQAKIVKEMESLGLGTKSTRAEILEKLFDRKYLSKGKTLYPSELGKKIIKILEKYVPIITSPDLTANLEKEIEEISSANKEKEDVVRNAREFLKEIVGKLMLAKEEINKEVIEALKANKIVGKCPKCGGELVIIRSSKTKKQFIGCKNFPKCTFSIPLPQKKIEVLPQKCEKCEWHLIRVYSKRSFVTCINPDCEANKLKRFQTNK